MELFYIELLKEIDHLRTKLVQSPFVQKLLQQNGLVLTLLTGTTTTPKTTLLSILRFQHIPVAFGQKKRLGGDPAFPSFEFSPLAEFQEILPPGVHDDRPGDVGAEPKHARRSPGPDLRGCCKG